VQDVAFEKWLESNERMDLVNEFSKCEKYRSRYRWRNNTNKNDCGVYVLRHMETFDGSVGEFSTGLTAKGVISFYLSEIISDIVHR